MQNSIDIKIKKVIRSYKYNKKFIETSTTASYP